MKITFKDRALPLAQMGIPVAWANPETKKCELKGWQELCTTDTQKILEWDQENPERNVVCVSKAKLGGVFFLEIDKPNFHTEIQRLTGHALPVTFAVSSRPGEGRGHFYFRHTPETIRLAQQNGKAYISGVDEQGHEAWSLRWNNSYVVGPRSIHPDTKKEYQIIRDVQIADGPTWLVNWCADQTKPKIETVEEQALIHGGRRNTALTAMAGKLLDAGFTPEDVKQKIRETKGPYIIGGCRLEQKFLSSAVVPSDVRVLLYRNFSESTFAPTDLLDRTGVVRQAQRFALLIQQVQRSKQPAAQTIEWSDQSTSAETFYALPLSGRNNELLGILLVGSSRRELVLFTRRIESFAVRFATAAFVAALPICFWLSSRVFRRRGYTT